MTATITTENPPSKSPSRPVTKWRWAGGLFLGTGLWFAAVIASEVIPQVFLGLELEGPVYALVGVIRAVLGLIAVAVALRFVKLRLRDVGLVSTNWDSDVLIGSVIAVVLALVQFIVIIPNTGGAARSDVAANAAQIGDSIWGVFGFVVLAWTGAFSEELFFRGHFFTTLRNLLGGSRAALMVTIVVTVALFAAGRVPGLGRCRRHGVLRWPDSYAPLRLAEAVDAVYRGTRAVEHAGDRGDLPVVLTL